MADRIREWLAGYMDRIALRFGYCRLPPTELIVFDTYEHARRAGFRRQMHPEYPHMLAWWPGLGVRGLLMLAPQRVTISHTNTRSRTPEGELVDILLKRQKTWGDRAMWIEI